MKIKWVKVKTNKAKRIWGKLTISDIRSVCKVYGLFYAMSEVQSKLFFSGQNRTTTINLSKYKYCLNFLWNSNEQRWTIHDRILKKLSIFVNNSRLDSTDKVEYCNQFTVTSQRRWWVLYAVIFKRRVTSLTTNLSMRDILSPSQKKASVLFQ